MTIVLGVIGVLVLLFVVPAIIKRLAKVAWFIICACALIHALTAPQAVPVERLQNVYHFATN
jgi:hypothetical protein